jgi:hypothetical protein
MDTQIAKRFDTTTLRKMAHSALLLCAGTLTAYVADNVSRLLGASGIPVEMMPFAVSLATWGLNTLKVWLQGQTINDNLANPQ